MLRARNGGPRDTRIPLGGGGDADDFLEKEKRLHWFQNRRIAWYGLVALAALAIGITALFFPVHQNTFTASELAANLTCADGAYVDASCIPDTLNLTNLVVTNTTELYHNITLHGNVYCHTPIWPSCLDISGQACMYPLQTSCMPEHVDVWNVTGELTVNHTTCAHPLGPDCIGTDLVLSSLTVTNLTVVNMTHVSMTAFDELYLNGPLTCNLTARVDPLCVDIDGEVCESSPISDSCMQPRVKTINGISPTAGLLDFSLLAGSNVAISSLAPNSLTISSSIPADLTLTSLLLEGNLTCGEGGLIGDSCLPPRVKTINGISPTAGGLDFSLLAGSNVAITSLSPNSLTISSTVPSSLNLTAVSLSGGNLTCSEGSKIEDACLPDRIKTINGQVPVSGTLNFMVLDGANIDIVAGSNSITISADLTCAQGPFSQTCIPSNLTLDNLVVNHLTVLNMSTTTNVETQNVSMLISNWTVQTGPFTCSGAGYVDPGCVDISGETCTSPISDGCMQPRVKTVNGISPNGGTLDFSVLGSSSILVTPITNGISLSANISGATCVSPLSGSCVDISGETCSSPIGDSCLPNRIKTVNGITPVPGTLDFSVLGSSSIIVTPVANGISLSTNISGLSCAGGAFAPACVDISGETCTSPITDGCMQPRVKTINGISPTAGLNFGVVGGSLITVTGGANQITVASDISGASCGMPINANCVQLDGETCMSPVADSCMQPRIKTINGISPVAGTLDFLLTADPGLLISPITNGDKISLDINALPLDPAPTTSDYLLEYDVSAGAHKKVLISSLPTGTASLSHLEVFSATPTAGISNPDGLVLMTGMTATPAAGTWRVEFSASLQTASSSDMVEYGIYVGDVLVAHSKRYLEGEQGTITAHTQAVVTVNGSTPVEIKWLNTHPSQMSYAKERSMFLLRL